MLRADPVRLTQMLVNVLNNAVKFTPPGGHIYVVAETVGEAPEHPDQVRIRIRDDGIGIAPELRPKIFDLFTQGDRSLERTRGGLGVGLTLVRNLAHLHDGSVDVRSDGVDSGTEVILDLPIERSAQFAADDSEGRSSVTFARALQVAPRRVEGQRAADARLAMVHVSSHSRQRHKVVTVIVLASVSNRLPWQKGHAVGRPIASLNRDSDIVGVLHPAFGRGSTVHESTRGRTAVPCPARRRSSPTPSSTVKSRTPLSASRYNRPESSRRTVASAYVVELSWGCSNQNRPARIRRATVRL